MKSKLDQELDEALDAFVARGHRPAPIDPTAAAKARVRFAQKQTEAVLQDAVAHNCALAARLEAERAVADWKASNYQRQIDECWQRTIDARDAQEALRTCHRGPGDPDWGL
jgi:hypothetical protein